MKLIQRKRPTTWIGWLNFLVLQWFWIRLGREIDQAGRKRGFLILTRVYPLTGWWWSDFRFLRGSKILPEIEE